MANSLSAEKRIGVNKRNQIRNKAYKSTVRTVYKKCLIAINNTNEDNINFVNSLISTPSALASSFARLKLIPITWNEPVSSLNVAKFNGLSTKFWNWSLNSSIVPNCIFNPKFFNSFSIVSKILSSSTKLITGITVGNSFMFDPSNAPVPWLTETEGFWQITNVEHKVDDSKWETIIEFKYRVGK